MSREGRHYWDTPVDIEDGDLDENSSSSDDISNAVRCVTTSLGSPVNSVLNNPPGKTTVYCI